MEEKLPEQPKGFWQSLPGIIVATTGLVTAVTALTALFVQSQHRASGPGEVPEQVSAANPAAANSSTAVDQCRVPLEERPFKCRPKE
jgi:hypothetical protein